MTLKNSMTLPKTVRWWDISGMFFSSLCLLHCIATPVLLAGATIWFVSEWVHMLFLVILIPITSFAVWQARAWQNRPWVFVMLLIGLLFVGGAILAGQLIGESAEVLLTVAGSLLLIVGHIGNRHTHRHHHTHV